MKKIPSKCKLFISQSMQHSTADIIKAERDEVLETLKTLYPNTEFELIEQCYVKDPESWNNKSPRELRWARLGRSIEMMAEAYLIVFVNNGIESSIAPGCKSEMTVAKEYLNEYKDEYQFCTLNDLKKEVENRKPTGPFLDNILQCVKYDTKKYDEYTTELINVIKPFLPDIDFTDYTINDTTDEWFIEFYNSDVVVRVSLEKAVLIADERYDFGRFYLFEVWDRMSSFSDDRQSQIIIRSIPTDNHRGIYVDHYTYTPGTHGTLFDALNEYVGLKRSDIKELN